MRVLVLLTAGLLGAAQSASFDIVSVHVSTAVAEGRRRAPITTSLTGVTAQSANVLDCVEWAYGLRGYQVVGPDWLTADLFDIVGKTAQPESVDQLREMMKSLLAERFHLVVHREVRPIPVWTLVPARRTIGLTKSRATSAEMRKLPGGGLRLEFRKTTLPDLAAFLSTLAAVDRPVRDASGLTDAYDFHLDLHEVAGPWGSEAERLAAPSLSTVLQEQLGLRMESRKDAVDVLVVDRVERPTPN